LEIIRSPANHVRFGADRRTALSETLHVRGIVLPDGVARDIYVSDGRIQLQPAAGARTVMAGGWILPGLVDAHAHLQLASPAPEGATPAEQVRASARAQLAAGVLLVREPGGPSHASQEVGPHEGLPRVVWGGRLLAPPGQYFPGLAREVAADELPAAAEQEARASGAWAKVIADFADRHGRAIVCYPVAALAEAVRRVRALGARLAVHATFEAGIDAALEAGVDSIEHGVGLREHHIAAMRARGVALVPTLVVADFLDRSPGVMTEWGWQPETIALARDGLARHWEMVGRAAEAGVPVLAGTDAGMGPHGMVREEVRQLRRAGLSAEAALGAASWTARRWLGFGGIEEGAVADLVGYAEDPREQLGDPVVRVLNGRVV
jgi:imidazolonepropionase-like amidohydrolase